MLDDIKIGIAPLTWTNDDMPELGADISFEQCIAEMEQAGYAGCEIGNKYPTDPMQLKVALQRHKLSVASQWFGCCFTDPCGCEDVLPQFKQQLTFLQEVGAKRVNICEQGGSIQGSSKPLWSDHKPIYSDKQWHQLTNGLNQLGQIAKDFAIQVSYHQHMGTGVQSQAELDRLMEATDPDLVGLLLDTGHFVYADISPLDVIAQYGSRINHVHLKDLRLDRVEQVKQRGLSFLQGVKLGTFTVPGDGDIDFKPILKGLFSHDYKGWLLVEAEQDPAKAHPLTFAQLGRDYIRTITGL